MWIALAFIVAFLLVAVLSPKPNIENAKAAKFGDLQFPRSKFGDPLPLFWGTVRQKSPITLWYGDYRPEPITTKVKTGLFSSKRVTTGYKIYIGIDCLLAIGPSVVLKTIWADNKLVWQGTLTGGDIYINLPDLFGGTEKSGGLVGTVTFYNGSYNPNQDPYLISKIGPNVPAYNAFARALFKSFYIGTQTTPKAFSFEIQKLTTALHATYSKMPNGLDANPMEIAYDAIVSKYGKLGNLEADLELTSFVNCAQTLYNEGLGMSLLVQSAITGKDLLEEVFRVADGVLYQDPATSKIIAKLIRDDYDVNTLLVLDESSILKLSNFQKTTWENTFNQCRVTFKDRLNSYDDSVGIEQDYANIAFQGRIKSTELSMPSVKDSTVASKIANRQLSILSVPLYKCDIVANRKAQKLRPGDVFVLNWNAYYLSQMVMRVTKIDLGDLTDNKIKITAVQDRFSVGDSTFAIPEIPSWTPITTSANPITVYKVWVPPCFLTFANESDLLSNFDTNGRFHIFANPPSNASLSYDVLESQDAFITNFLSVADVSYNGSGLLLNAYSNSIASTDRHDIGSTLVVTNISDLAIANLHNSANLAEAVANVSLLLINNELFLYVGFTNNGNGVVTFNNVYRGILDTIPASHAQNDRVWFISGNDNLIPELIPTSAVRSFKLLDKTVSNKYDSTLASSFNGTMTNRASYPLPPQYLTIAGSRTPGPFTGATTLAVAWKNRSRLDTILRVYNDSVENRETGTQTRIRWRIIGSAITTVYTTSNTININVTGLTGTLEVTIDTQIIASGVYSTYQEVLTATLN